jgi:H+/gluconate symporter-like permease
MRSLITLIIITAFAAAPLVRAADTVPSPSPEAAASPTKKHSKKTKATANVTATPAVGATPTTAATTAAKRQKAPEPQAVQAPGGGKGQVWVNTETHVYHKEGSKWYGRTKHGKYISEADAVKEGDRPSKSEKP